MAASAHRNASFPTTQWTLVQRVQKGTEEEAAAAMNEICRQYWYPLYAFARRSGFSPVDAEDLAQKFFEDLIQHDAIHVAQQQKGRLRSFMCGMLKRLISKHVRHSSADKRGAGEISTSWDELTAEERYRLEPASLVDPEKVFDRAWAEQVLDQALKRLREEFEQAANLPLFQAICGHLPFAGCEAAGYSEIAERLAMKENAVRQQVRRMRQRFAALTEEHIAETVEGDEERRDELQYLMTLMG
jgi:RNA polymerase sigma-70 factor (ECF subfamily)